MSGRGALVRLGLPDRGTAQSGLLGLPSRGAAGQRGIPLPKTVYVGKAHGCQLAHLPQKGWESQPLVPGQQLSSMGHVFQLLSVAQLPSVGKGV